MGEIKRTAGHRTGHRGATDIVCETPLLTPSRPFGPTLSFALFLLPRRKIQYHTQPTQPNWATITDGHCSGRPGAVPGGQPHAYVSGTRRTLLDGMSLMIT